jgi:hypothetical protein
MIQREGYERTWREMCPITSLFTTNPTQTGAGSNPGLHSNCLSHNTVYKTVNLNVICIYATRDYLQCTNKEQKSLNVVQNSFRIERYIESQFTDLIGTDKTPINI